MMASDKYPSTWEMTSISDVVYFQEGPGLRKFQYREEGVPFLNIQTLENERVNKEKCKFLDPEEVEKKYQHFLLETNDIVCSSSGTIGKTAVIREEDKPLMLNTSVIRFRPWSPELFSRKYLHIFLKSQDFISQAMAASTGSAQINFGPTHLKTFVIPVPPLNEQKRIVAKIEELFSELDNGIASLKTAREQLKVYRQAVLKHAFEGKLTAKWREENADKLESPEQLLARIQQEREASYQRQLEEWKAAVKEWETNGKKGKKPSKPRKQKIEPIEISDLDDLFNIPEQWKWVFLNELSEHIVDGTHHTPDYTGSGVPFISAKDIKDFKIDFEDTRFIDKFQHKELIKRCRPRKNSVLLTKSGTIGRVALVDTDLEFSLFESVSNIPLLGNLQGRFVMWAVYFQVSTYFGAKNQKGVAVRHLHLEDIRRLPIPLPSYNEQTAFVERIENIFDRISENEAAIDTELLRVETLRQSILKKAFSGQLVPQDPSDEPASELLARIQAEKESVNTQKARKSKKIHSSDGH